nr:MAG: hypothetical protein [Microvirus sp.]
MKSSFSSKRRQGRSFGKSFRKGMKRSRKAQKRISNYRVSRGGVRL